MYWFAERGTNQSVDWFVFVDFSQKVKWYVHYTTYHVENIIKTYIIYLFANHYLTKKEKWFSLIFVFLSIYRLLEYWLFRHHIPYIAITGIVLFAGLFIYSSKKL